jgi:diketogulonate reductase-like aldo/keto reductase
MERRAFGRTGVEVPVVGQGTWQLRDPTGAEKALRAGLELGMTHVDTAELYTGSEAVVGRAIAGRRDDVFLVSKVLPRNASFEGTKRACDATLKRLETDRLDVYLLHWNESYVKLDDTMRAMRELIAAGMTRFAGVSNLDVDELGDAQRALKGHEVVCDQVLYHLGDRGIEHELIPYCAKNRVAVVAYSPFGGPSGVWPPGGKKGLAVLERIGARHGKTPRQVCLNFLTRHENVFAIPKAENEGHVRENAGSVGWQLDERDLDAIESAFPLGKQRRLGMI